MTIIIVARGGLIIFIMLIQLKTWIHMCKLMVRWLNQALNLWMLCKLIHFKAWLHLFMLIHLKAWLHLFMLIHMCHVWSG